MKLTKNEKKTLLKAEKYFLKGLTIQYGSDRVDTIRSLIYREYLDNEAFEELSAGIKQNNLPPLTAKGYSSIKLKKLFIYHDSKPVIFNTIFWIIYAILFTAAAVFYILVIHLELITF